MQKRRPFKILRSVLFALVIREVRGKFGANRLGAFWFVFEPLAHIIVLLTIFTLVRGETHYGPPLPMFLVTGIIPFILFKNIALKGMEAVPANKALFAYRQIKPFDTIIARVIVECALMACVYIAINFVLGFWLGYDVAIHYPLKWIAVFLTGIIFSTGLALIFCVIGEALPELKSFIKILFMPLYFMSCVIVPLWVIPAKFREWLWWNPLLHLVDGVREATFLHYPKINGVSITYAASAALVTLFVGITLYRFRREQLQAI
ncbi:sugar ABC transporter permease [Achromobacter insolitus]|uniref:ABC transporter permease n=1 Tax=Achromobacter insolitus TaxID=217204 RepID=UPI0007C771DD|nr:ABC transporter permease [Achromobacter insolitus]OAE68845.1 sugar ABC transporter permease [Achromobacter insolitus]OCZ51732.1 sugar ABC transporter permease [Achromobacter insolitus]